MPDSQAPVGQPTRGKTAHNRLRRVDHFIRLYDPALIRRRDRDFARALFVDLGYGASPWTTLESAARLQALNPELPVLGVEIDPTRVARAQSFAGPLIQFRQGDFELPLRQDVDGHRERVRLIRAFNVLRQYEAAAVPQVHAALGRYLLPSGLLIEGTSDPFGQVWVANLLRRPDEEPDVSTALLWEGLLFSTNFRQGFEPRMFQPVLPKNLIHRVVPGDPVYDFFADWERAYREVLSMRSLGLRQLFRESARQLATRGYTLNTRFKFLSKGYLLWKFPRL